jgi:AraC-like DNA-binding protein
MPYRELSPPPALSGYVTCLWARTETSGHVLPDGCVDLVWTGADLLVAGPATRPVVTRPPPANRAKLGVRFRLGAAGPALGESADELVNLFPRLGEIWGEGGELAERMADAPGDLARMTILTTAVSGRLGQARALDPILRSAVIELSRPRARIARLCRQLAISERQLRRRFNRAVGYSPRTLARVLRLQRFLVLARRQGGDLALLAAEAGYADQPHLTRECAELAGRPAAALLATGAGPAGEELNSA